MNKKRSIYLGVASIIVVALFAGGFWYYSNSQILAAYEEQGVWNSQTYDYDVVPVGNSTSDSASSATSTAASSASAAAQQSLENYVASGGSSSSTGLSGSTYSGSSSSTGSSSAKQNAVAEAKARCLASESKPGRLLIIVESDSENKPIAAAMWLTSLSGQGEESVFVGSDNRTLESGEVNAEDVIQIGSFSKYGSLTNPVDGDYVYYAETGQIPSGEYSVNVIIKDNSSGELRQITEEFKVEPCVHSTMSIKVESAITEEEVAIEDEKFCFALSDGTQFYGTQTEYASFIADSDGSIGISSMVIGPCEGEAQTASEESSENETGDNVSISDNQSSSDVTGVGVGVSSGDDEGVSILFGGGFDASSLGDSSAALETALEDSKSLDSGAQKLLEGADKGKAESDQLKKAGKAIESGDSGNEDVLALEEKNYTQEQIIAAYEAYQAIEGALAKLDESELLALAEDSIIASGVVEEVLGDEVAEALEQGAQLASDALSEVSGITERTGVAVDIAESWLGSIGAAINSTLSGILGGLF